MATLNAKNVGRDALIRFFLRSYSNQNQYNSGTECWWHVQKVPWLVCMFSFIFQCRLLAYRVCSVHRAPSFSAAVVVKPTTSPLTVFFPGTYFFSIYTNKKREGVFGVLSFRIKIMILGGWRMDDGLDDKCLSKPRNEKRYNAYNET